MCLFHEPRGLQPNLQIHPPNCETSICSSCLLLPPQGGIQYKPRSLFVDLSGSLGGVSLTSSAAPISATSSVGGSGGGNVSTWGGGVQVHHTERVPRSSFLQRLDELAELDGTESGDGALTECGSRQMV